VVEEKIKTILSDILNIDMKDISDDFSMENCESWDSFMHMTVIMSIEDEFSIKFDDDKLPELNSLITLISSVQEKI